MSMESWHSDFNPRRFLSRVSLDQLIARNDAYNESVVANSRSACLFCSQSEPRGILLNDRSFLCLRCYGEVSLISYPEKYEASWRQFLIDREARRLAREAFRERFEYRSSESSLVFFGCVSLVLAFANPMFLIFSALMLAVGYAHNAANTRRCEEWNVRRASWEQANPEPGAPDLRHFHDSGAELTDRDRRILRIFNHWPGYPPFWKYLRAVVIERDGNRCQVTGCPSRLELHVHHMKSVAEGGSHTPDNLVSLCDFHHALEPEKGHERIWGDIRTRYFTLVCGHSRINRASEGAHDVRAHLRRLQLVTFDDLQELAKCYGFACPSCGSTSIAFTVLADRNLVRVECRACHESTEGPRQLAEEAGPRLAEILTVSRTRGRWSARWDMLAERKVSLWGTWSSRAISSKRRAHKQKVEDVQNAPKCPQCGAPMRLKKPWKPDQKWRPFWGCTRYDSTGCKGSVPYNGG